MMMPPTLLPLDVLGAVETAGTVTFGLWLPWVSAADGNSVSVKIIHERDQFLQDIPAREFAMSHSIRPPHGDFWSVTVPIAGTPPPTSRSAWGSPGRYVYRYQIDNPNVGTLDWIIDPFAREFGVGPDVGVHARLPALHVERGRGQLAHTSARRPRRVRGEHRRVRRRPRPRQRAPGLPRRSRRQRHRGDAAVQRRRVGRLGLPADRLLRRRRALRQALRLPGARRRRPPARHRGDRRRRLRPHRRRLPVLRRLHAAALSREPVHGAVREGLLQQLRQEHRLRAAADPRLLLLGQPPLARGVPRRRLPLRLRAELLGRRPRRRLRQPGVRDLPAHQGQARRPAVALGRFDGGAGRAAATDSVRRAARRPRGNPADDVLQLHLAERHLRRGASRSHAATAAGWPTGACAWASSAIRSRPTATATSSPRPPCSTWRTTTTSASSATSG